MKSLRDLEVRSQESEVRMGDGDGGRMVCGGLFGRWMLDVRLRGCLMHGATAVGGVWVIK